MQKDLLRKLGAGSEAAEDRKECWRIFGKAKNHFGLSGMIEFETHLNL